MRGKASPRPKVEPLRGITPAYAGKSAGMHAGMAAVGDHPRVCGEKLFMGFLPTFHPGSPPRVRGKAKNATLGGGKRGITPACAGKSCIRCTFRTVSTGSPPRVRGKVRAGCPAGLPDRITPACAGKSSTRAKTALTRRDHPRVCGEKFAQIHGLDFGTGSPPRVRGKVICGRFAMPCRGITPACAGKSRVLFQFRFLRRDHPRVCGEKELVSSCNLEALGSPPRVRGKAIVTRRF